MKEKWKSVYGYEGFYEVSNFGKVRSVERFIKYPNGFKYKKKSKKRKLTKNNSGYLTVSLFRQNKEKRFLVHRLVARAFCKEYNQSKVVNHIDGDRLNNNAANLEWCEHWENIKHGKSVLKSEGKLIDINKNQKLNDFDVLYIRDFYRRKILNCVEIAKLFKVNYSTIRDVVKYKNYKYLP